MTEMRLGLIQEEEDKLEKGQGSTKELTIETLIGKSKMTSMEPRESKGPEANEVGLSKVQG